MFNKESRSLFWPILLIGVGVIWLLGNLGVLPEFNFLLLLTLWPLILIVLGLHLIVGRRFPIISALAALLAVGGAIAYVYLAEPLNLYRGPEVQEASLQEPLGSAESLSLDIDSSVGRTTVQALNDSGNLLEAEIAYVGTLDYDVEGTAEKHITLRAHNDDIDFDFLDIIDEDQLLWSVGLSPEVPVALDFSGGVGEVVLNLTDLLLTDLQVDGGVGEFQITLPAVDDFYRVRVNGGVGEFTIVIEEGADVQLDLEGGVGEFLVDVPDDAAVSLDAETSVGSISVASFLDRISSRNQTVGESGVWETPDFDEADRQIIIRF